MTFGAGYYLGRRSHGGDGYGYGLYGLGGRYHYAYPWYGGYSGYGIGLGYGSGYGYGGYGLGYGSGYGIGIGLGYGSGYYGSGYGLGYGYGYGHGYGYPGYGYNTYYYLPYGTSGYDDSGTVIVDGDYVDVDVNGAGSVYTTPGGGSSGYAAPGGGSSGYAVPGDASSDYAVPSGPVPVDEAPEGLPPVEQSVPDSEIPANVARGIDAFSAGLYDDARAWFLRAVLADTADPYAKLLLGLAHFANGDFDASAIAVRRALTTSPRLLADPIDLRIFYRDPAAFDEQLNRLVPYASTKSGAGSDEHGGDAGWLLSYLYFATGNPNASLAVLDRLTAAGSDDDMVPALRDAVGRVLSNRARAIAPSNPSK